MSRTKAIEASASPLPEQPVDRLLRPLARFLHIEAGSGLVLVACTVVALVAANSPFAESYLAFWKTPITLGFGSFVFQHSLHHVINDGLMAIFFFVIGLEVKREIVHGSLSDWKQASLPIAAAIGGMIVPAALYLSLQYGQPGMKGWGIPMATDIAFVIGCLALLGSRVPRGLRVLLLSLAIVDDIGAILVIAVGYTESLDYGFLFLAVSCIAAIQGLSRIGVRRFVPYIAVGALAWLMLHESGIHATLIGVILGLQTPSNEVLVPERFREYLDRKRQDIQDVGWAEYSHRTEAVQKVQRLARELVSPREYLEIALHPWSAYGIMPLFALANAGVAIELSNLKDAVAVAVILGLVVGKPLGIVLMSWLAVRIGWGKLPEGVTWPVLLGGGCLAGIGFTMALFIEGLAFGADGLDAGKTGVLIGSAVAVLLGMGLLLWTLPSRPDNGP
ncbi:MAG: Na+/H+ antiporter NhaA [Planctomycetaceae bacterium]|nr:Na+/H+ antiporter NhaA [Planctomycetales bacterium]MCB9875485.1 Na+/H+ antiporter NhaA [Planctomycetaceae bacterium]HRX77690.1 Na+/H+ antiporter NhaA [Pirellulaceae bacterium]